ncbi:AtpZ/AtpI family protein [Vibrio parahaemolyticus]|uniref:AtpZ/AtpI family protein n=1 Tax=Vibrio natriegens TaxID=691 RepID=UPI0021E7C7A0|nr:AtpZ/AtpI family protein [Vibrio natriegens]UYI49818.1 AtpZ/AtpI family protein [Vibrio natriegens]WMN88842.1 AtpZ/AtpI family protein [Vibrio parahaemolyticus]
MHKLDDLKKKTERQVDRMKKAERERHTLIGQTIYLGTLGLLLALPIVGGAYLGHWIDSMIEGYSVRWTISFILLGVIIGMVNVYLLIRQ